MKPTSQHQTDAWLLKGIHSLPGALKFANGRLSFTAFGAGNLGRRKLRKFETETGQPGLAQQLDKNKRVVVFDVPLAEVRAVNFPWYYFSGGVKFTVNGVRYRFGFDRPANTRLSAEGSDVFGEISKARRSGKAWKAVLTEQSYKIRG